MKQPQFPKARDAERVGRVLEHYEQDSNLRPPVSAAGSSEFRLNRASRVRSSVGLGSDHPLSARPDRIIHGVWSQVRSIWPRDGTHVETDLSKVTRLAQKFEEGPVCGLVLDECAQMHVAGGSISEDDVQTEVLIRTHGHEPPRRGRSRRRHYSSGGIGRGGFSWRHNSQFSIRDARLFAAHSSTRANARGGRSPRVIWRSRISIVASCSPYVAWKCGGPCSRQNICTTMPKNTLIVGIAQDRTHHIHVTRASRLPPAAPSCRLKRERHDALLRRCADAPPTMESS